MKADLAPEWIDTPVEAIMLDLVASVAAEKDLRERMDAAWHTEEVSGVSRHLLMVKGIPPGSAEDEMSGLIDQWLTKQGYDKLNQVCVSFARVVWSGVVCWGLLCGAVGMVMRVCECAHVCVRARVCARAMYSWCWSRPTHTPPSTR